MPGMRKIIIQCGFFTILAASATAGFAQSAEVAPGKWTKFINWLSSPVPQPQVKTSNTPAESPVEVSPKTVAIYSENAAPSEITPPSPTSNSAKEKDSLTTILADNGSETEQLIALKPAAAKPAVISASLPATKPVKPALITENFAPKPVVYKPVLITESSQAPRPVADKTALTTTSFSAPRPVIDKPAPIADKIKLESAPQWNIKSFPMVKIGQKNYPDINLNEYIVPNPNQASFIFSLTPGKANPNWVSFNNNRLHITADKISLEDIHTTQIIYLTVTNPRDGQFTSTQMTIQISTNDAIAAPTWQPGFHFQDAISSQPYNINLAAAIKLTELPEKDQLTFELIKSPIGWFHIEKNGFSLAAKKIPNEAAGKTYPVVLRVTSKMSGKSSDYSGDLYVNPSPLPFQWQALPAATLNQKYAVDLSQFVRSNIRNDKLSFHVDLVTLPYWLSIQNNRILSGSPLEASILEHQQKINIIAKSLISGMTSEMSVTVPVNRDEKLVPEWKKDYFTSPIAGENYRSDDLASGLANHYAHDEFKFTYLSGPDWLTLNKLCHCLVSKGLVPNEVAGKNFTVQLQVYSKASDKTVTYSQNFMVYRGVPQWVKTNLPEVRIGQNNTVRIPLSEFVRDDINGDRFAYRLDPSRSPSWIRFNKEGNQFFLKIQPEGILVSEVGTTQTVRLVATSQITHKTSEQLLTVHIQANPDLTQPSWKNPNPAVATVGFQHVMNLREYIQSSVADDKLKITLGAGSPSWLSIKDNRLTGIAPKEEIGGPYPLNLVVHSQATGKESVIHTQIKVQLAVVEGDNMELHSFYDNHQSIVIRGLKKNHSYRLSQIKGNNFDYGPFYSPYVIKSDEDWNNNPFYSVDNDKIVKTGEDGLLSIVYYSAPNSPPPSFQLLILS